MASYLSPKWSTIYDVSYEDANGSAGLGEIAFNVFFFYCFYSFKYCNFQYSYQDGTTRSGIMTVLSVTNYFNYKGGVGSRSVRYIVLVDVIIVGVYSWGSLGGWGRIIPLL